MSKWEQIEQVDIKLMMKLLKELIGRTIAIVQLKNFVILFTLKHFVKYFLW